MVKMLVFSVLLFSCQEPSPNRAGKSKITRTADTIKAITPAETNPHILRVEIEKLNKEQFYAAKQQEKVNRQIEKITDFETVQKRLSGIVAFKKIDDNNLGISQIHFRNGTLIENSDELTECGFVAYFPADDVLLLEGGHTTDVSFDLATGQGTYDVGNPDLITTSPGGKYRLNKVFEGQECFEHFIQEKQQGKFQKIAGLNELFEKITGKWLCVIEKAFWTDDHTLYFGLVTQYHEQGNQYEFYKVMLK